MPLRPAELVVSRVEIIPEQPLATVPFSINVDLANQGQLPLEEFDLVIYYQTGNVVHVLALAQVRIPCA